MALVHHWKLDEANATDVAVDSVGGLNLTPVPGSEPTITAGFWGNARRFASGQYLQGAPVAELVLRGPHTLSWWMRCSGTVAASGGLFFVGMADPSVALNRNWVAQMRVEVVATVEKMRGGHTRALGTADSWQTNDVVLQEAGLWMLHVIVLDGLAWQYYCQGVPHESGTFTALPYEAGVTAPTAPLPDATFVGRTHDGTSTPRYLNDIEAKDVRLYNHALIRGEVETLFIGGVNLASDDSTAPVISNVTPAAPNTIGRNDSWSARVTDNVGFRRIMLWVKLTDASGNERGREVIWDGSEFAGAYSTSTRTEVTAGKVYDFVIRRNAGWPFNPSIRASAIDTAGNEGT